MTEAQLKRANDLAHIYAKNTVPNVAAPMHRTNRSSYEAGYKAAVTDARVLVGALEVISGPGFPHSPRREIALEALARWLDRSE